MACLINRRFARDDRGISDILAMAFMFLIVIFAGVLLHAYRSDAISSAANRQLQMKAEYLYRTLELAYVENYSRSYFQAVAENLIGENRLGMRENYLDSQIDNLLDNFLRPPNYVAVVELTYKDGENIRIRSYPRDMGGPSDNVTQFTFLGKVTVIIASENVGENSRVEQIDAKVTLYKL